MKYLLAFILVACARPAPVGSSSSNLVAPACGQRGCLTAQDCNDIFSQCRYCYLGQCSAVLPAAPPDAGADASIGTKP